MSLALIRQAFETRLKTWADAQTPAIPVAWQNVEFTPPAGRYVRAFLIPAPTTSEFLEKTDRRYGGIFQVSFCMTIGSGAQTVEALVASLDAAFSYTFTQGSVRVWLERPFSAAPPIPDKDRFVVPVSAPYQCTVTP